MRSARVLLSALVLVAMLAVGAAAGEVVGKFAVTPLVGLDMPIQYLQQTDAGGRAKLGFAFGATGEYFVTENVAVGGRFVFNRFGMDFGNFAVPDDWDGNWTMLEFGVFGKYLLQIPDQEKLRPFVRGGIIMGKADAEITGPNDAKSESDVSMTPGLEIAAGAMHEVADNINVYGEVGYTLIATDGVDVDVTEGGETTAGEFADKHLQWIGIKVGATFLFGGAE